MNSFKVAWQSPSNIALVKYWGKREIQIPENSSVSFTLKNSLTTLEIEAIASNSGKIEIEFYFEGKLSEKFEAKISKFLLSQESRFPWLLNYKLIIQSTNTFPHSSGIASSASSMSALNLCLMSLDEKINHKKIDSHKFFNEASHLSRLASGSASRSVYPYMATWGEIPKREGTSNLYASGVAKNEVHEMFHEFCDAIIIVDANEKSVSSRAGHALMETHPFRKERYELAAKNLNLLLMAMKNGDMNTFVEIVEEEALMLHALMMTSTPSYILLKPDSLLIIEKIREFRKQSNIPVCFTIDAGPNIHVLYPKKDSAEVGSWLNDHFSSFKIILDEVGNGPKNLKD